MIPVESDGAADTPDSLFVRPSINNCAEVQPPQRRRNTFDDDVCGHQEQTADEEINTGNNMIPVESDGAADTPDSVFVVGEAVNELTRGDPYLAGYITKIEGDDIYVKFPYGRFDKYEYKYQKNAILPFTTQFPNGIFKPIKLLTSRTVLMQRRKIQEYEQRLSIFFSTQRD